MSSTTDALESIVAAYNEKLNSVAAPAVGIQLALMAVIGVSALSAFSLLRPKNTIIYQPKVKYSEDDKHPPKIGRGIFDWVEPVFKTKEADLMHMIGLDGVTYLRALRMCRSMLLTIAIITCAVLIPINVVYNILNVDSDDRGTLMILTISKVKGDWLWAHIIMTYALTLIVFFFIWRNYEAMILLRWQYFRSDEYQNSLHSRSLLITQINKHNQSDQGVNNLLRQLAIPYPTTAVHIGRKVGTLPELIEAHNDAVRKLEAVLTSYFKNPDRLPTNRPTMRVKRKKVDAIDFLTAKIQRFEERIELARQDAQKSRPTNYGFASFEAVPFAHIVARKLEGKSKQGTHFQLAPQPQDIIWRNLTMKDATRAKNKFFGGLLLVVFCFFYTIPLLAVALLANLSALSAYVKFIREWQDNYSILFSAFVGVVPSLLTFTLQLILPIVIRKITSYQGALTHSQADRAVTARYSAFLLITQFFVFSLFGVAFQIAAKVVLQLQNTNVTTDKIVDYLLTIPDQLQNTWIVQSSYWLTVFPLRGAAALFDVAQIISLLVVGVKTRLFGRTPREIREWTKPSEFDYPVMISNAMLVCAVSLVYSPIAPIVPVFGAGAFAISSWVYKYQLMYVCVSRVETGGRLWNVVVNRVLAGLVLMQLLMVLSIGLQKGWYWAIGMTPPLVMLIIFKVILVRRFDARFRWFIPTQQEIQETHVHNSDARKGRLQRRFGHPSLHEPLFTPQLHKHVQHLLPTIYNGRIGQSAGKVDGNQVEAKQVEGGLRFDLLEAHDLQFDRNAYLRQRDEDAMTVTSAGPMSSTRGVGYQGQPQGPEDEYFAQRRKEYLEGGGQEYLAGGPGGGYTPGLDDLPEELARMPTNGSTEQLIGSGAAYGYGGQPMYPPTSQPYGAGAYPPSYSGRNSPNWQAGHPQAGRNASQASFGSQEFTSAYPYPQGPPGRMSPSSAPMMVNRSGGAGSPHPPPGAGGAVVSPEGRRTPTYGHYAPQHASGLSQGSIGGDFAGVGAGGYGGGVRAGGGPGSPPPGAAGARSGGAQSRQDRRSFDFAAAYGDERQLEGDEPRSGGGVRPREYAPLEE